LLIDHTTEFNRKKSNLFLVLGAIVLTNAIVAEIIGVKIFSLSKLLGQPTDIISVGGFIQLNSSQTAGVLIWPIVFVTSDIINEYFGKAGVKKISYITAIFIAYSFLIIFISTLLPPAQFWLDVNSKTATGEAFNINFAFSNVFRQGLNIILGSITAFLVGQLTDSFIFHFIRKITGNKWIWLRATGSTLISQLIDCYIVIFVAFYFFGNWSFEQAFTVANNNYVYKAVIAIAITPVLYIAHNIIDKYLGKKASDEIIEEAAIESGDIKEN